MPTSESVPQTINAKNLGTVEAQTFRRHFSELRNSNPQETVEASIWYIATHGLDATGKDAAFFLTRQNRYLTALFGSTTIPDDVATKALLAMKEGDAQYFSNYIKVASALTAATQVMRALALLQMQGDYTVFVPWLRSLANHSDERVRAQASKMVAKHQPNRETVERQLRSNDGRVRADIVESLWRSQNKEATDVFRQALNDPHHRVVTNALVGLHLQNDKAGLENLLKQATHSDPFFRSAAAWALGYLEARSALPAVEGLANDSSALVRKRASKTLEILRSRG